MVDLNEFAVLRLIEHPVCAVDLVNNSFEICGLGCKPDEIVGVDHEFIARRGVDRMHSAELLQCDRINSALTVRVPDDERIVVGGLYFVYDDPHLIVRIQEIRHLCVDDKDRRADKKADEYFKIAHR